MSYFSIYLIETNQLNPSRSTIELPERLEALSDKQASTTANPNSVQMITAYNRDGISGEISVSLLIPSTSAGGAGGTAVISATEVFG